MLKDCDKICHSMNEVLPHFSITKHSPVFKKVAGKFFSECGEPNNTVDIEDIYVTLCNIDITKDDFKKLSLPKRFMHKFIRLFLPKDIKTGLKHMAITKNVLNDFGDKRKACYKFFGKGNHTFAALYFTEKFKLGNCYENALITKLILRMNGIKNAEVIALKDINGRSVHTVCAFNRNGSKFKNIENNNTIIIDTWAGKSDFAQNMISMYRNQYKDYFILPQKGPVGFEIHKAEGISKRQMKLLKTKYHKFVFRNKDRYFMQPNKK